MTDANQSLGGFALILAYAIPVGLMAMMAAQALRGRKARRKLEEAEAEFDRYSDEMVASLSESDEASEGETEPPTLEGAKYRKARSIVRREVS